MTAEQREAFISAATELARAFRAFREQTKIEPVLVGGATVVVLTAGRFFSGDFDFTASNDEVMAECMAAAGFLRETGAFLRKGWYHPKHPAFGFEQVSGSLFDGRTERDRLFKVELREGETIVLPPVEDMIADRLAQHSQASPTDTSRLDQARAMLVVSGTVDRAYLLQRVEEEGGDIGPLLAYLPDET